MTLIETAVAIALLVVIVISILSAFSAVTLAATRYGELTALDRLTRSDAEFIKSQAYSTTGSYNNLSASGYNFAVQVLFYQPATNSFLAAPAPDNGLQQLVLTVSGPNATSEKLDFLKVQP
jgi:hypothetical protein